MRKRRELREEQEMEMRRNHDVHSPYMIPGRNPTSSDLFNHV